MTGSIGSRNLHLAISAADIGRRTGGNESYLLGLLRGLEHLPARPDVTLLLTGAGVRAYRDDGGMPFNAVSFGAYRRLPFLLWQQTKALRKLRPDWYVSTFFLPPVIPCRAAVLLHDLSFRSHPEYFPTSVAWYMRLLTWLAVRRADRVIVLSEFTQRETGRYHPSVGYKTVVIPPGVDECFGPEPLPDEGEILASYGLVPGYIVAIGNIHPRKNLGRLLDAWVSLRGRRSDVPPLVWVGLQRWDSGDLIQRAAREGVLLPGFVAQEHLPVIYRNAALLVYPSLYEGFGLPPLEALACGTPVVASATTSVPESVGDAGLLVDPLDTGAIASGIERLLDDTQLRAQLRAAGLARAAGYRWSRTAQQLVDVLSQ